MAVIDLEGTRSLSAVECDLGFVRSATMQISNIGRVVNVLLRDKDRRQTNSGFQPVMKLIQEIVDFLAIITLKKLHA